MSKRSEIGTLISYAPKEHNGAPPILFVHGAFAGAWCWDEFFLPWFADAGYHAHAIDLPGRRGSPEHKKLQDLTIDDYLDAVMAAVEAFDDPPVIVGHSMGGWLAWRVAETTRISGLVLMAPVPPTGLAAPALQLAVSNPALAMDVAAVHNGGTASVDTLLTTLFSRSVPRDVAEGYISRFQNESQVAVAGLYNPRMPNVMGLWGTPIMVLGAEEDQLIPPEHVHWTASISGRLAHIYEDMGHGMMLENEWQRVAEDIASWIAGQGLLSASPA